MNVGTGTEHKFPSFLGQEVTLLLCCMDLILHRAVIISVTAFLDVLNWLFHILALSPFVSLNNRLLVKCGRLKWNDHWSGQAVANEWLVGSHWLSCSVCSFVFVPLSSVHFTYGKCETIFWKSLLIHRGTRRRLWPRRHLPFKCKSGSRGVRWTLLQSKWVLSLTIAELCY